MRDLVTSPTAWVLAAVTIVLAGCARSAVLPVAADTVQITISAAPACGAIGAQNVALRRASIETINRGFERFIILGTGAQDNVRVVGHTPMTARTSGSTTTFHGGFPIFAGTHDQRLLVKMFMASDPAGANAVSARDVLGKDWREIAKQDTMTTC